MPLKDTEAYKAYMRQYLRERWKKRKKQAIIFLGEKCARCNTTENLQFDHKDRSAKIANVGVLSTANNQKFWEEVKKCQLLCEKCHMAKSRPEISESAKIREKIKRLQKTSILANNSTGRMPLSESGG